MVDVVALGQESSEAGVVLLPVFAVIKLLPDDALVGAPVGMSSHAGFAVSMA